MTKKDVRAFEAVAGETGLKLDQRSGVLYGTYRGYLLAVCPGSQRGQFNIVTSVCAAGEAPDDNLLREQTRESKACLAGCRAQGYYLTFLVKASMSYKKTLSEKIPAALEAACQILSAGGYVNCCQDTGSTADLDLYMCGGAAVILGQTAFTHRSQSAVQTQQAQFLKKENLVGGIVGAFLGSLLGMLSIVLVGQLGYVAALCGFVMAACTVKGYELLGGKLTKKGVILGVIFMVIMVYVGNRADWALSIVRQLSDEGYALDIFTSFQSIPYWLDMEMLDAASYYGNLAIIYVFTALGAFPTIKNSLSASPLDLGLYRLSAATVTSGGNVSDVDEF